MPKPTAAHAVSRPIRLGDRVKDRITGFTGIVICETTWLNGCRRFGLQPEKLHEGKPVEDRYFDEGQLVNVKADVHQPTFLLPVEAAPKPAIQTPGGPARETRGFRRS